MINEPAEGLALPPDYTLVQRLADPPESAYRGPESAHKGPESAHRGPQSVHKEPESAYKEPESASKGGQPGESWQARDNSTGDLVLVRFFRQVDPSWWEASREAAARARGLVHENLVRVLYMSELDSLESSSSKANSPENITWLVEPWLSDAQHFSPEGKSREDVWQLLAQLINLIIYAHESGIPHGRLHPGNVLVHQGQIKVTGFGMPRGTFYVPIPAGNMPIPAGYVPIPAGNMPIPASYVPIPASDVPIPASDVPIPAGNVPIPAGNVPIPAGEEGTDLADFLSPEARQGRPPDKSDDIYSLGAFVFWCLTRTLHSADVPLNTPLPPQLEPMVRRMLSDASWDRGVNLPELAETLKAHFESGHQGIPEVNFSRSDESRHEGRRKTDDHLPAPLLDARQRKIPLVWVSLGLAVLLLAAAAIFILPETVILPESSTAEAGAGAGAGAAANRASIQPTGPTPFELARLKFLREESEAVAEKILRLQVNLEDAAADVWAGGELATVTDEINRAEDLFSRGEFETALELYKSLQAQLAGIEGRKDEVLAQNIEQGEEALASGEAEAAISAWTIVTAIAPDNADHAARLADAENLPGVISLTNQALADEREGQLDAALEGFRQASRLIDNWQAASAGAARVEAAITQRAFTDAMSAGFVALASKDYAAARAGFAAAEKILPDSTEPDDGLLQVEQSERADLILSFQRAADQALANESWQAAIDDYRRALAMDASLVFARDGLAKAERRLDMETRLQGFLADPARLQEDESLKQARQLLAEASRLEPLSRKTRAYIGDLAQVISTARITFPLTLLSDRRTEVIVYKVGRLGSLERRQLDLIPGRYTIIGKRAGYRDVRHDITLAPGRPLPPVTVVCDERI